MSLTESALFVPAPSTTRGAATKLGASPDGKLISYGAGRNAVIRPIDESGPSQLFGHPANVTVAKLSPVGGYYCASGDVNGNFKVWDTTGAGTVKLEAKPIARINDIAWDGEGKRLVLVGDGRAGFGATFSLDTGASIGEISGHSKIVNSVAMRPSRPFRAVTASDDMTVCVSNGVPFKFTSQSRKHSRFVTSVDYAPNGGLFVSAGSDGNSYLYDGATGEDKGASLDDGSGQAHKGTIFQASFSKDSAQIATSGADGIVKLWDVATSKVVQTWDFAGSESSSLLAQQVGNVWAGSEIVTLSFSGVLSVLDVRMPAPSRKLYGHQTAVTALASSPSTGDVLSGDSTGLVRRFSPSGVCSPVSGSGHSNLVVSIVRTGPTSFSSTSYDDSLKSLSPEAYASASASTGAIPKGLAPGPSGSLFLATAKDIQGFSADGKKDASLAVPFGPTCIAASQDGKLVAVGGEDSKCRVYSTATKGTFDLVAELTLRVAVTACAFSPDSTKLAVGGTDGKILLFETATHALLHARFSFQSARVNSLAFDAAGGRLAAGSLDESVRVYDLASPANVLSAKNVHRGGVAVVVWENEGVLVSGGADGAVKKLKVA
ncbi:hypothetical protein RQP46_001077 [Phenoliferia psychrophenolica]